MKDIKFFKKRFIRFNYRITSQMNQPDWPVGEVPIRAKTIQAIEFWQRKRPIAAGS